MTSPLSRPGPAVLFIVIAVLIDAVIKYAVEVYLPLHRTYDVLPFLGLFKTYNPGIAFSLLSDTNGWALVAMISCGVAEAYRRGDHIAIDLLTDRLRGPSRAVQRVFAALAVLVLSGVLFLSTWEAVEFFRMFGSYTTGHLEIPGWIPQAPLMLAAAMLVLVALTRILDTLAGRSQ